MRRLHASAPLAADARGATIVEFAMILPVLLRAAARHRSTSATGPTSTSVLQGALHEAARMATVGSVSMTPIETHVANRGCRNFAATRDDRRRRRLAMTSFTDVSPEKSR